MTFFGHRFKSLFAYDANVVALFAETFTFAAVVTVVVLFSPVLLFLTVVSDGLLWLCVGNSFLYNISWEDPQIDIRALQFQNNEKVITLCSAGDNALDYVIEGARVTAVDLNPYQIALCELKRAMIQYLTFQEFFAILAKNDLPLLREKYGIIRPHLTKSSQKFWDKYIFRIKNFMYAGTSGKLAFLIFRVIFPLLGLGWVRKYVIGEIEEKEFCEKLEQQDKKIRFICWIAEMFFMKSLCALAGVPKIQLKLGLHRPNNIYTIARKIMSVDLRHENYFYGGYIAGSLSEKNCPRYLKKENFDTLQQRLRDGYLELVCGKIEDYLKSPDTPIFTIASLLDHMDWMSSDQICSELSLLISKMDQQRGKIFWRSFSETLHSGPLLWLEPKKVDDSKDRVFMYFSTWMVHLRDMDYAVVERKAHASSSNQTFFQMLWTGIQIVTYPIKEAFFHTKKNAISNVSGKVELFYKFQKEGYDGFREHMLHARPILMTALPILKRKKMVWIDVGGGTARNLEFFHVDTLRTYFKAIYIVDVSPSLLEIAARRIRALKLDDFVILLRCDFTSSSVFEHIPQKKCVDIITFSYSLSMISNSKSAIRNSLYFLKPRGRGIIGIADFFVDGQHDTTRHKVLSIFRSVEKRFLRWWFANDGVHLLDPNVMQLLTSQTETIWEQRFRGSVPFLPFLKPMHGVFIGSTR
ncbi:hypothetical protein IE077_002480 [Cardiosporidium cionae]|uniref:Betaine lipid synthase n=1 Tax=Cardiosporidium cionae TaxID=476202 RepID=A0ABQ7JAQ5_9APIC|nr:hypothetical protein IE077_002480 [Cardiosporidium cionae]|eukprot:KAF8821081.1 hypothetical protein IE077_002480 [Cardiosporidium cionae]